MIGNPLGSILTGFDIGKRQDDYIKSWERLTKTCTINGIDSINEHKVFIMTQWWLIITHYNSIYDSLNLASRQRSWFGKAKIQSI